MVVFQHCRVGRLGMMLIQEFLYCMKECCSSFLVHILSRIQIFCLWGGNRCLCAMQVHIYSAVTNYLLILSVRIELIYGYINILAASPMCLLEALLLLEVSPFWMWPHLQRGCYWCDEWWPCTNVDTVILKGTLGALFDWVKEKIYAEKSPNARKQYSSFLQNKIIQGRRRT